MLLVVNNDENARNEGSGQAQEGEDERHPQGAYFGPLTYGKDRLSPTSFRIKRLGKKNRHMVKKAIRTKCAVRFYPPETAANRKAGEKTDSLSLNNVAKKPSKIGI